jgi:hypothetical protein
MATHRLPILGFGLKPDTSGKVWIEPQSVLGTNDVFDNMIVRIDNDGANNAQLSTRNGVYGRFFVPKNYVGTAAVIIHWTATVTSGNVVFDFEYRAVGGDDAESLDQSGTQESVTGTDANPSAAWERNELSINLTGSNFAVDDTVNFFLARDGVDANDTAASATLIYNAFFQYADA